MWPPPPVQSWPARQREFVFNGPAAIGPPSPPSGPPGRTLSIESTPLSLPKGSRLPSVGVTFGAPDTCDHTPPFGSRIVVVVSRNAALMPEFIALNRSLAVGVPSDGTDGLRFGLRTPGVWFGRV